MSDRDLILEIHLERRAKAVEVFMDGDTGTWRLFICPEYACADFTLSELREFHAVLTQALVDIDKDPDSHNAEVRRTWER